MEPRHVLIVCSSADRSATRGDRLDGSSHECIEWLRRVWNLQPLLHLCRLVCYSFYMNWLSLNIKHEWVQWLIIAAGSETQAPKTAFRYVSYRCVSICHSINERSCFYSAWIAANYFDVHQFAWSFKLMIGADIIITLHKMFIHERINNTCASERREDER